MANDPSPVVVKSSETGGPDGGAPKRASLSIAEAELFASRIQPSWELVDDSMRDELAAELGLAPAGAAKPAGDTIIEGVPSMAIGSGPLAVPPEAPVEERIAGIPVVAVAAASVAEAAPAAPAAAPKAAAQPAAEAKKAPAAPPARAGKTKTGVGDGPKSGGIAKTLPDTAPRQAPAPPGKTPAPVSRPAAAKPAGKSAPGVVAASASRPDVTDDIEIPVTGASQSQLLKIGLGLVAVIALGAIGYGVLGGSSETKKDPSPTPTATAATTAAVPLPATIPPPPAEPPTKATAVAPSAPSTTATTAATTAPKASEPKAQATKPPAPSQPAVVSRPSTPAVKKSGGGIIRETPF